MEKMNKHFYF